MNAHNIIVEQYADNYEELYDYGFDDAKRWHSRDTKITKRAQLKRFKKIMKKNRSSKNQ